VVPVMTGECEGGRRKEKGIDIQPHVVPSTFQPWLCLCVQMRVCVCVCSLAVEPQYPQLCIRQSDVDKLAGRSLSSSAELSEMKLGPMELSAILNSLPCSLTFTTDDHLTVIQTLVALVCSSGSSGSGSGSGSGSSSGSGSGSGSGSSISSSSSSSSSSRISLAR